MIRVSGLSKRYSGEPNKILDSVDLEVGRGEILHVFGASGAGKSTLLNVVGLLTQANSGNYIMDGHEMLRASRDTRQRARRDTISMVFQRGNLFPHLTALHNIMVGMSTKDRGEAERYLRQVRMGKVGDRLAASLSGGEQNRAAFARAMARGTPVLLADEPLAGLDDENVHGILGLLKQASAMDMAVVVVSHDHRISEVAATRLELIDGVLS